MCQNDSQTEVINSEIEKDSTETTGTAETTEIEIQAPMTDGNGPMNMEGIQPIPIINSTEPNQLNLADNIDEKPHSPENLTVTYTQFICSDLVKNEFNLQKIFSIISFLRMSEIFKCFWSLFFFS